MARLPDVLREQLAPEHQELMKRDITLYRCLANSPNALRAFQGLGQFIRYGSTLDARLRELAILQVGWVARAPYEWSHHIKIGMDFGVTEADIHALIADSEGRPATLDDAARLVLRAARECAAGPGISADTFAALRAHFNDEHMTDLVVTISFYCAVVRFLASMEIEVEPEYQKWLDRFPLPA